MAWVGHNGREIQRAVLSQNTRGLGKLFFPKVGMPSGTIPPAAHPPSCFTISTDFPGNPHHMQPLLSQEML